MPIKRPGRRPRLHRSYLVEEAAKAMGVCKGTMRRWIASGALPVIDAQRPAMVRGRDLIAFAEKRRSEARQKCPPGWFYCLRCRTPRPPALGMVEFVAGRGRVGNLKALCAACETVMNRRCTVGGIGAAMPNLEVTIRQADPHIGGRVHPSLNVHFERDRKP